MVPASLSTYSLHPNPSGFFFRQFSFVDHHYYPLVSRSIYTVYLPSIYSHNHSISSRYWPVRSPVTPIAMWSRPLATLIFLSSVAFGQDLPGPGEPALTYADGSFTEPRGSQSTYRVGSTMNVSWDTTYDTSNLWLIIGWSFNSPIQLACESSWLYNNALL